VPAPSNAASLLVELTVGRANGSSGTLYFDNVLVR
jgi:hypothetical protein